MKRYLLFAGSTYYPAGGWHDFRGDFDSIEEAKAKIDQDEEASDGWGAYDWSHCIDSQTKEKVSLKF